MRRFFVFFYFYVGVKGARVSQVTRAPLTKLNHDGCGGGGGRPESEEQSASVHTLLRIW